MNFIHHHSVPGAEPSRTLDLDAFGDMSDDVEECDVAPTNQLISSTSVIHSQSSFNPASAGSSNLLSRLQQSFKEVSLLANSVSQNHANIPIGQPHGVSHTARLISHTAGSVSHHASSTNRLLDFSSRSGSLTSLSYTKLSIDSTRLATPQVFTTAPNGSGLIRYPAPNIDSFIYDPVLKLRFDPSTGLHYDANTGFFYNSIDKLSLYWDQQHQTYLLSQTQHFPNVLLSPNTSTVPLEKMYSPTKSTSSEEDLDQRRRRRSGSVTINNRSHSGSQRKRMSRDNSIEHVRRKSRFNDGYRRSHSPSNWKQSVDRSHKASNRRRTRSRSISSESFPRKRRRSQSNDRKLGRCHQMVESRERNYERVREKCHRKDSNDYSDRNVHREMVPERRFLNNSSERGRRSTSCQRGSTSKRRRSSSRRRRSTSRRRRLTSKQRRLTSKQRQSISRGRRSTSSPRGSTSKQSISRQRQLSRNQEEPKLSGVHDEKAYQPSGGRKKSKSHHRSRSNSKQRHSSTHIAEIKRQRKDGSKLTGDTLIVHVKDERDSKFSLSGNRSVDIVLETYKKSPSKSPTRKNSEVIDRRSRLSEWEENSVEKTKTCNSKKSSSHSKRDANQRSSDLKHSGTQERSKLLLDKKLNDRSQKGSTPNKMRNKSNESRQRDHEASKTPSTDRKSTTSKKDSSKNESCFEVKQSADGRISSPKSSTDRLKSDDARNIIERRRQKTGCSNKGETEEIKNVGERSTSSSKIDGTFVSHNNKRDKFHLEKTNLSATAFSNVSLQSSESIIAPEELSLTIDSFLFNELHKLEKSSSTGVANDLIEVHQNPVDCEVAPGPDSSNQIDTGAVEGLAMSTSSVSLGNVDDSDKNMRTIYLPSRNESDIFESFIVVDDELDFDEDDESKAATVKSKTLSNDLTDSISETVGLRNSECEENDVLDTRSKNAAPAQLNYKISNENQSGADLVHLYKIRETKAIQENDHQCSSLEVDVEKCGDVFGRDKDSHDLNKSSNIKPVDENVKDDIKITDRLNVNDQRKTETASAFKNTESLKSAELVRDMDELWEILDEIEESEEENISEPLIHGESGSTEAIGQKNDCGAYPFPACSEKNPIEDEIKHTNLNSISGSDEIDLLDLDDALSNVSSTFDETVNATAGLSSVSSNSDVGVQEGVKSCAKEGSNSSINNALDKGQNEEHIVSPDENSDVDELIGDLLKDETHQLPAAAELEPLEEITKEENSPPDASQTSPSKISNCEITGTENPTNEHSADVAAPEGTCKSNNEPLACDAFQDVACKSSLESERTEDISASEPAKIETACQSGKENTPVDADSDCEFISKLSDDERDVDKVVTDFCGDHSNESDELSTLAELKEWYEINTLKQNDGPIIPSSESLKFIEKWSSVPLQIMAGPGRRDRLNNSTVFAKFFPRTPTNFVLVGTKSNSSLLESKLIEFLAEHKVKYVKVLSSVARNCGLPFSTCHIIFDKPEAALKWSSSFELFRLNTPKAVSPFMVFSTGHWICPSCNVCNHTLSYFCHQCYTSIRGHEYSPFRFVDSVTRIIGLVKKVPYKTKRLFAVFPLWSKLKKKFVKMNILDPLTNFTTSLILIELQTIEMAKALFGCMKNSHFHRTKKCFVSYVKLKNAIGPFASDRQSKELKRDSDQLSKAKASSGRQSDPKTSVKPSSKSQFPLKPDGLTRFQYPVPKCEFFTLEPLSGLYFDHETGLYYHPDTDYFYNDDLCVYLKYDKRLRTYVRIFDE